MFCVPTMRLLLSWAAGIILIANPTLGSAQMPEDQRLGILSLEEAQARARDFSPQLEAGDLSRQAVKARRDQAHRRPNPGLNLEWENLAGSGEWSGVEASEWTLSVSQIFDLSGKRGSVQGLFNQEILLHDWDQRSVQLDLMQEVGLAFAEVWFAQETVALAREQKALAEQLQVELMARLEAGGCSPIEVTRARVGVATAEVTLVKAQERQRATVGTLVSLWGSESPDFEKVALASEFWNQDTVPAEAAVLTNNPDLARWNAVASLLDSRLKVVKASAGVDLELAMGLRVAQGSGDRALVLGAGLPLPLRDRNQDEVRAVSYEKLRSEKLRLDARTRTLAQLAAAVEGQNGARREMDIMAAEIIPLARQAYEETRAAHQRGLFSLTDVLQTRGHLFELRQAELESQLRFLNATLKIARLTGWPAMASDPASPEVK